MCGVLPFIVHWYAKPSNNLGYEIHTSYVSEHNQPQVRNDTNIWIPGWQPEIKLHWQGRPDLSLLYEVLFHPA